MGKTRFFTEQVAGGSRRGEASDEDLQRGITDFGAEENSDDSTFFMPEGYVACGTASLQRRSGRAQEVMPSPAPR